MVVLTRSAVATGITRNGVISSVRTIPRPMNLRLTRIASAVARTIEMITAEDVSKTVFTIAERKTGSANTSLYSSKPTNLFEPGVSVFQLRRLYQIVTMNDTWVTTTMYTSAGMRGSRRAHARRRDRADGAGNPNGHRPVAGDLPPVGRSAGARTSLTGAHPAQKGRSLLARSRS